MNDLTMASLFSGSGGFELASIISGIKPVWLSEIEPFPVRVTEKRFPDVKNYGDVSTIKGGEIPPVDIISFGSPCFPAGTMVLTDEGYRKIEEIKEGDSVLTHKGRWKKVTATGFKEAETVILKGHHFGLECTPNHPILTKGEGKEKWIEAGKMKGKKWCVPKSIAYLPEKHPEEYKKRNTEPLPEFSEGFFYFLGKWLGGGQKKSATYEERMLCEFFACNFEKHTYDREMPSWVFSQPEKHRTAVLGGG